MKQATREAEEKAGLFSKISKEGQLEIIKSSIALASGAIFSGASITTSISPFGVSLVSALSGKYSFFALVGAVFGYFAQGLSGGFVKYVAALLVIVALKWAFAAFLDKEKRWALCAMTAGVNLLAGAVWLFTFEATVYDLLLLFSESVICGSAVYFISKTLDVIKEGGGLETGENIVCLSLTSALFVIALSEIVVGFISIGNVIAIFLTLALAYSLKTLGGACAGLSFGAVLSIKAGDSGFMIMALGVGGMLAGVFSHISRYATALLFLICAALSITTLGAQTEDLYFLYECIIASIVFIMAPERFFRMITCHFPSISVEGGNFPNKYLSSRLKFVSDALSQTSQSISGMSERLMHKTSEDLGNVFSAAADRVCRRCAMKLNCWDSNYNDTMDSFNHMVPHLKRSGRIEPEAVPDYLRCRCSRLSSLISEINAAYHSELRQTQASQRARQIKEIVTAQFGGISNILCEMSEELALTTCDKDIENRLISSLARDKIEALDVSCPRDKFGRKTVEFYCLPEQIEDADREFLEESISEICKTQMTLSAPLKTENLMRLTFSQTTPFKLKTAHFQSKAQGEEVCGDSFELVHLNGGFCAAILSDGMGHGKSAAIDSKMTISLVSRFLSLGFSIENCLSLVNSALMLKSEEETLSTLDVAIFDLYSGSVSFKKAGAAPSFIRRGRRISKVEMGSLPLGILGKTSVRSLEMRLSRGDVVILCSDGLCALSDSEIEKIMKENAEKPIDLLCEILGKTALESGGRAAGDDITIIAAQIV